MKTLAIIQARMASTRLPGKVLADIAGNPMLHHVVRRAQLAERLDVVLVATSKEQADDAIGRFCNEHNLPCFRGSMDDVLDRYYQAAKHFRADFVVRLTADCPLLDPKVIDKVMQTFHEGNFDYVSNTLEPSYPDGLDTEVFKFKSLERAWHAARLKSEREHVTPYIYKHAELFRLGNVKHNEDLSKLRWTVDEARDLEFIRAVYDHFGQSLFGMSEILDLLLTYPQLSHINAGITRDEGYQKSLREDELVENSEGT